MVERLLNDLTFRASAVAERIRLWRRLPPCIGTGHIRTSQYVPVRDGTRIAVDVYRPARRNQILPGKLPVVWTFDRYHRARFENGRLVTRLDREPWLKLLVRHGYIVGVADVRGSGASFGARRGLFSQQDAWDAYDVTEWLAAQPWSNGRIGMFGKSFMGLTQYLCASASPPHLRAIFPEKTMFDLYSFAWPGGVFRDDYAREWSRNTKELDATRLAAPVDADPGGEMLAQAVQEHQGNTDIYDTFSQLPFRDSGAEDGLRPPYLDQTAYRLCAPIAQSGVAVYHLAGWQDMWVKDAAFWHRNLLNPRKLLIGAWPHTWDSGWKLFPERLRWFDHWLKGVDNGIMKEPALRYYTTGVRGDAWRAAAQWPLPNQQLTRFYLTRRTMSRTVPAGPPAYDEYVVDYSATSGNGTRWKNGHGRELRYGDMTPNDAKALTYTTERLEADIEVTGHPVICLWLTCSAKDVDVFAYLEDVRENGYSEYVTEGVLRASHRAEARPPYDNLGLPYHRSHAEDILDVPLGEPVELRFDLHPVSRVFRRGRRLRVAITGADADNASTPMLDPPPTLRLYSGAHNASHIALPIIPKRA